MTASCNWTTEYLDVTGNCNTCPQCHSPNAAGNGCDKDANYNTCMNINTCTSSQIITSDGTC